MKKLHIWVGTFRTEKDFNQYIDQNKYLEAWAVYDNEPTTGDERLDAEPSLELRCNFSKEVNIDTYDEDAIITKYYNRSGLFSAIAKDLMLNAKEFESLLEKSKVQDFNSVIAYSDNGLSAKDAVKSSTVQYIGSLKQNSGKSATLSLVHYLWIGDTKLDKKNILKQASIEKSDVIKLNYYYCNKKEKMDQILILNVADYDVAEKMILKADEQKFNLTNSMLYISINSNIVVDGDEVGSKLGIVYVGKFETS